MDMDKLYEKYNILVDAKDKIAEHATEYLEAIEGTKSDDKGKKLATQIITKFFKHFPDHQAKALNAVLDLCEDDEISIRICALKSLPNLCKDSKEYLNKVVFILAQFLQLDDAEYTLVSNVLKLLYKEDPLGVIKHIFEYIRATNEIPLREKALSFLIKLVASSTNKSEVDDFMISECKKLLNDGNPEEFILIMPYLTSSKLAKTITGSQELVNFIAEQLELDQEFDPTEEGTNNTDKVITCIKYALPLFSHKVESTKFVIYICDQVLPHWDAIGKLHQGDLGQLQILRLLAEMSSYCGKLDNASLHVVNILDKIKLFMPPPPEDLEQLDLPNLDFSAAECLLYAFHTLARQCPDLITHDPEVLKDFRSRLMYFSRGVQSCRKALIATAAAGVSIRNEDKQKMKVAPSMLNNINSLIKDLFHQPPIYKCSVVLSFKQEEHKKVEKEPEKSTTQVKRHVPITFDSNGSTANKPSKVSRGGEQKLYTPPSGKFSNNFQNNDRSSFRSRGRGGYRGGRGGRNWRN